VRARLRCETGQAVLVTTIFMMVLVGGLALTLDVASWYRDHRQAQLAADAAALAGAQALPASPAQAKVLAGGYAGDNGGDVDTNSITFRNDFSKDDTVVVSVSRPTTNFFSRILFLGSPTVHAKAAARTAVPVELRGAAPIVVNKLHPMLADPGCPCFGKETTIPLGKNGMPGAFDLVNLDGSRGGTGPGVLEDWIENGFDSYLAVNKDYYSDPGAKFNSSHVQSALTSRLGDELLFPIYDPALSGGNGANAYYHVIGWVAFHLTSFEARGSSGSLSGYFTRVIWDGIQNNRNDNLPDYGVHTISLVR
jgi:Flp pilus assembly protein TadG